jgi:hypothetical protein
VSTTTPTASTSTPPSSPTATSAAVAGT